MENYEEQPNVISGESEISYKGKDSACGGNDAFNDTDDNGSSIGKFKTTEALVNAYNNLQAEFTRRSQRLRELERAQNENINAIDTKINQPKTNEDVKTNSEDGLAPENNERNFSEEVQEINNKYDTDGNENAPSYQRDYTAEFMHFLSENKDAKPYAKEIGQELLNDKSLSFQSAFDRVLAKKYKAPNELASDERFINDYILSNNEIIKSLIKKLKSDGNSIPTILQNSTNTSIAQAYPSGVSTIKEAGEIAKKLFAD